MNSQEFSEFKSISDFGSAHKEATNNPGVYLLRTKGGVVFPRIVGEADILYIGSTKNLKKRFYSYNNPGSSQYTNQKVRNFVLNLGHVAEFLWKAESDPEKARIAEHELISRFQRDHHEYPPLNGTSIRKIKFTLPPEKITLTDEVNIDEP